MMVKCKNCGHNIIYSDEHEFWFHEQEKVKWSKDPEYDYTLEEKDRCCAVNHPPGFQSICACQKPEPRGK